MNKKTKTKKKEIERKNTDESYTHSEKIKLQIQRGWLRSIQLKMKPTAVIISIPSGNPR